MAQLMPLPLTVSCFSKIQIGFTFLVPAHLGSPGQRAVKRVCVCVCVCVSQVIGCENRLRNDLYCVEWGVELYSNQQSGPGRNYTYGSRVRRSRRRSPGACRSATPP